MTTGQAKFIFGRGAQSSRLLSYALLFLFIYSSTAEAIHHHGLVARDLNAAASSEVADSGSVGNSSTPSAPRRSAPASECLVCQFQQNLSSAEIFAPLVVLAPPTSDQTFLITAAVVRSTTTSTAQGRGPPQVS